MAFPRNYESTPSWQTPHLRLYGRLKGQLEKRGTPETCCLQPFRGRQLRNVTAADIPDESSEINKGRPIGSLVSTYLQAHPCLVPWPIVKLILSQFPKFQPLKFYPTNHTWIPPLSLPNTFLARATSCTPRVQWTAGDVAVAIMWGIPPHVRLFVSFLI